MRREILIRSAQFEPSTFNEELRTVEVVFSTGSDVRRYDIEGAFIERLSMMPESVDLSEIRGAPVLNNHDRFGGVEAILGVVEDAHADGQRGVARVRFGQRPEIQGVVQDIKGGVIRSVSAGYTVGEWRVTKENGQRVKTAIRWTPKEISFTPLAADPQAKVRSMESDMELQEQIRSIAEAVGVRSEFADDLVQRNVNLADARAAIVREAARNTPAIENRQPAIVTRETGPADAIRAAGEALYARINPAHQLSDQARPYANRRIADLYRDEMRRRSLNALGSDAEIIARMHTISDFSSGIYSELFNKSLLTLRTAPPTITQVFRRSTVDDFREKHAFELSDGPALAKVPEAGEITYGTITDTKLSSYRAYSYARAFSLSFEAQVNDDMGALADLSSKMTRGARSWFSSFLVDTVLANPVLADSKAIFHADHLNLANPGAAPSDVTVAAAKLAMRLQVDASGNPIDAPPKFILVPATLEGTTDKLMASLYPETAANVEVAIRGLTPLVEPRLDSTSTTGWYLFADPSIAPAFEYSELSGYEGPRVEVDSDFDVLGTKIRVVWHVGAGAIDYRGAYKGNA